jgi:hypothetical protein
MIVRRNVTRFDVASRLSSPVPMSLHIEIKSMGCVSLSNLLTKKRAGSGADLRPIFHSS